MSICVASAASFRAFVVKRANNASEKASSGRIQSSYLSGSGKKGRNDGGDGLSGFSRLGSQSGSLGGGTSGAGMETEERDVELLRQVPKVHITSHDKDRPAGDVILVERDIEWRVNSWRERPASSVYSDQ